MVLQLTVVLMIGMIVQLVNDSERSLEDPGEAGGARLRLLRLRGQYGWAAIKTM